MADLQYFPGLIGLLYSFQKNSGLNEDQEIIIIYEQPYNQKEEEILRGFGYNVSFKDLRDLGDTSEFNLDFYDLANIGPFPWIYTWFRNTLKKLFLFRLTGFKKLIYLDVDMLVMDDITEMFEFEPLSAPREFGKEIPRPKEEFNGNYSICTGFMVLEPKEEYYQGLLKVVNENAMDAFLQSPTGDQAIVNWYFYKNHPEKIHMLSDEWGINTRMKETAPEMLEKRPKIIHYLGQKPWFKTEKTDSKLDNLWWSYFIETGFAIKGIDFENKVRRYQTVGEDGY